MKAGLPPLPFGAFIGERRRTLDARGFALAEIVDRRDEPIFRHTHADAHFCFILKGRWITGARGVEGTCGPATMIFNPAGTTHRDRFDARSRGGSFLTLSVAPESIALAGGHRGLIDHAVGSAAGELPALGARLHRELLAPDELSPLVVEGLALELLAHAAREAGRLGRRPPPWLAGAYELIRDGYRERLTVRGIATALGVHPLHLGRCFRRRYGCSPGELLRQCRVRHAAELLRRGEVGLAQAALDSGFADQAQLTKAFKRVTGTTPGRYRRLLAS
ncbi:MAG TPA: helix-turn-helix transcriptional regulator [Thermoanaerobaculia bacterium]|nr:helix-turn-helix transcriptional regulator [Thermoanaerobaculia bacterium]